MSFWKALTALTEEGLFRRVRLDGHSRALVTIANEHHEVHHGNMYRASVQADVAAGQTLSIMMTTPDSAVDAHLEAVMICESQARFELIEGPTPTGGTPLTAYNANRKSSNTATVTLASGATFASGTVLENEVVGGTAPGNTPGGGGESRSAFEWLLDSDTVYGIRATNLDDGANEITLRLSWYEATPEE